MSHATPANVALWRDGYAAHAAGAKANKNPYSPAYGHKSQMWHVGWTWRDTGRSDAAFKDPPSMLRNLWPPRFRLPEPIWPTIQPPLL